MGLIALKNVVARALAREHRLHPALITLLTAVDIVFALAIWSAIFARPCGRDAGVGVLIVFLTIGLAFTLGLPLLIPSLVVGIVADRMPRVRSARFWIGFTAGLILVTALVYALTPEIGPETGSSNCRFRL